ncbi:MAG TPA: hypothetical protein VEX15_08865 [Nocardioidaceae bacterium]|nr:hypothetical protein [Nocardioidaceae bacterium]
MDTVIVVVIVIVVVVAAGVAAAVLYRRRSSDQLGQRFGPEYERALEGTADRREAEKDLRDREKHRSAFEVTPVTGQDATRYRQEWADIRLRFVDQPAESVEQADRLVVQIMRESGYPVDDFEHRVDDISVDHPDVAQHYREAHEVAVAQAAGVADTEQLRQAVTSYGQLVDALLRESQRRDPGADRGSSDDREHT